MSNGNDYIEDDDPDAPEKQYSDEGESTEEPESTYMMGIAVDLPKATQDRLFNKIDDVRLTVSKASGNVRNGLVVVGVGIASIPLVRWALEKARKR